MPPKRKTTVNLDVDQEQDDIFNNPVTVQSEDGKMASPCEITLRIPRNS